MQRPAPAARGPAKPKPKPAPQPVEPVEDMAGLPSGLHALFPLPSELAADAVTFAGKLLRAVEFEGARLRKADVAAAREVLFLASKGAPLDWGSAGRVLRLVRLHLSPAV